MDKPQPRLIANRANARLSTGPRTAAGKARARLNARRHGLAGDLTGEPDVEQLIGILGRDVVDPEQRALVREIAESQCTLNRAQAARRHALQAGLDRVTKKSAADAATSERLADDLIGHAVLGASDTLVAIDRYERRAFSRRRKAIRTLTRLVAMERESIISSPLE